MNPGSLHHLAAFAEQPGGGNPAGVWIGDTLPDGDSMLRLAADLGYSETAFIAPDVGPKREIRYFSPLAEVAFCGHATIASGVMLGRRDGAGRYVLATRVGEVVVDVEQQGERWTAQLLSVEPRYRQVPADLLVAILDTIGWRPEQLDASLPPALAFAGAWHLVLAAVRRDRLDSLDYDFERLKAQMLAHRLTTLQLVWRESATRFHSRNPFPVGGVVEDPATGAAAAALGGYLRDAGLLRAPARFEIRQGEAMGRPSVLQVEVPASGGIVVSGTAVDLLPESA